MAIKTNQVSRIPVSISKKNKPANKTRKKFLRKPANSLAGGPSFKKEHGTPKKRKHPENEEVPVKVEQHERDVQSTEVPEKPLAVQPESKTPSPAKKTTEKRASTQLQPKSSTPRAPTGKRAVLAAGEKPEGQLEEQSAVGSGETGASTASSTTAGQKVSKRQKRNRKAILKRQVLECSSQSKTVENKKTEDTETSSAKVTEEAEKPRDVNQDPDTADSTKTEEEPPAAEKKNTRGKGKFERKGEKFNKEKKKFTKKGDATDGGKQDRGTTRSGFTPQQQEEIDEYRKSLEAQGAPREVVSAAIYKKVRSIQRRNKRTAEKRCNKICLSCRKQGHLYKDCPEASHETGCCFKCGSKEHTSRECPNKSDNYAFATCYICKEKGHLAKHCKHNPHGLYVRGGCCHYCGDIRHLARECPNKNRTEGDSGEAVEPPQILAGTLRDNQTSADADLNEEPPMKVAKTQRKRGGVVKF